MILRPRTGYRYGCVIGVETSSALRSISQTDSNSSTIPPTDEPAAEAPYQAMDRSSPGCIGATPFQ
jgi:hypothetical protein